MKSNPSTTRQIALWIDLVLNVYYMHLQSTVLFIVDKSVKTMAFPYLKAPLRVIQQIC